MPPETRTNAQLLVELEQAHRKMADLTLERDAARQRALEAEGKGLAAAELAAALAERERFAGLSLDVMAVVGVDGYFKRINPALSRILGWSEHELLTSPIFNFMHPDDRAPTLAEIEKLAQSNTVLVDFENRYRCKDGTYRSFSWRVASEGDLMFTIGRDVTERRAVEVSLARQADLMNRIVAHAPVGMSYLNRDLVYEWVNPTQAATLGIAAAEFIGKGLLEVFGADGAARIGPLMQGVLDTGKAYHATSFPFGYEVDGEERITYWDFTYQPAFNDGEIVGVMPLAQEVSERVEKERLQTELIDALKSENERIEARVEERSRAFDASQSLLGGVLDSSNSGIFAADALRDAQGQICDFRFTLANPMCEQLIGRSADELIGHTLLEFFPDVRDDGLFAAYKGVTESGLPAEVESYYRDQHLDFWLHVSVVKVGDGVAATFSNITESKLQARRLHAAYENLQAQAEELRQASELTDRIIASTPAGMALLNRDLVFEWANPTYARLVQIPAEQLVGHQLYQLLGPETEAQLGPLFSKVLLGEPCYATAFPFKISTQQDRQTYWDFAYQPERDAEGKITGVLMLCSEVSDRVEHERLQEERLQSLQQGEQLKDQFLGILSHELRTPLNAIQGFGSILDDGLTGELNEQQALYIGKILDSSDKLLGLVDDLLDMSRMQAGKFTLDPVPVDFAEIAQGALVELAGAASKKQQALVNELPEALPVVLADPGRTGQVLVNLISNAIKYTPEGGSIAVKAQVEDADLRVTVDDNGVGIAAAEQARIFQAFTQVDMTNTRSGDGVGLGLSIVKALVEAQGGAVGVESAVGRGSRFWFTVPLAR